MARTPTIIVGGTPAALLAALMLQKKGHDVELVDPTFDTPPPFYNPTMTLMGGNDNMTTLMLTALQAWSTAADMLGDEGIGIVPEMDIATSAGIFRKLQAESVLDVLAGYDVTFETKSPPWLPNRVTGYKHWEEGPMLPFDLVDRLRAQIVEAPVFVHKQAVMEIDIIQPQAPVVRLADGTTLTGRPLVLACAETAMRLLPKAALPLPLRPACGHILEWQMDDAAMADLPQPFPCIINRLPYGHLWLMDKGEGRIWGHYDALCDPSQARFGSKPSASLEAALAEHVEFLLPVLSGKRKETFVVTHFLTPDFLPALGVWPVVPGLVLAIGWGGLDAMFAALAGEVVLSVLGEEMSLAPALMEVFKPNRFAVGTWEKVAKPGSLDVSPAELAPARMKESPELSYMGTVQQAEAAQVQRASTVQQVGKNVTRAAALPEGGNQWGRSNKPRIQTAAVKS